MSKEPTKPKRGRPKTIDRSQIIEVALMSYWDEGVGNVSLNEICRRTNVSKPGVYREFGNEEGLILAVLRQYQIDYLIPYAEKLKQDAPFQEVLKDVIRSLTIERPTEMPLGCLAVTMDNMQAQIKQKDVRVLVERLNQDTLDSYIEWIAQAKLKGEFPAEIDTTFAGTYLSVQISNTMSQQKRGEDPKMLRAILEMAFSMFL